VSEDAFRRLGEFLTGTEADQLAELYGEGLTLTQALQTVSASRRQDVRSQLEAAGVVPGSPVAVPVLRAVQGANARRTSIDPVWTLPGYLADYGTLTTSLKELVLSARHAVTCSTFNFQKSSALWEALREVSLRGTVDVRVYMDANAARGGPVWANTPTCEEVGAQLAGAKVFRTTEPDGKPVRNHAKLVAVDHQFLIVTSANFSKSAEERNIELGLRVQSRSLAELVERQLLDAEAVLYERVQPSRSTEGDG
jgi:hypothetical protein